jgi:hypothetical protein
MIAFIGDPCDLLESPLASSIDLNADAARHGLLLPLLIMDAWIVIPSAATIGNQEKPVNHKLGLHLMREPGCFNPLRRNERALDVYTEVRYRWNIKSYGHTDLQEYGN